MDNRFASLPKIQFAFPGPLRDALVAAVLAGEKTTTTGTLREYEVEGEDLPRPEQRFVVVDSDDRPVGVIETVDVRVITVGEVDLQHAVDEGEGYESVADWRREHERFWHSDQMREALGYPHFTIDDDTPVVAQRFHLVERL